MYHYLAMLKDSAAITALVDMENFNTHIRLNSVGEHFATYLFQSQKGGKLLSSTGIPTAIQTSILIACAWPPLCKTLTNLSKLAPCFIHELNSTHFTKLASTQLIPV